MFSLCRHKDVFDPQERKQTMWAAKEKQGAEGDYILRRNNEALADYVFLIQAQ